MTMSVWFFLNLLFYFTFSSPFISISHPPPTLPWCILHYPPFPHSSSSSWMVCCATQPLGIPLENRTPLKAPHPNACKMGVRAWSGLLSSRKDLLFSIRHLQGSTEGPRTVRARELPWACLTQNPNLPSWVAFIHNQDVPLRSAPLRCDPRHYIMLIINYEDMQLLTHMGGKPSFKDSVPVAGLVYKTVNW